MEDKQEFEVIEISPNAKYVIVPKVKLSMAEYEHIAHRLTKWQKSDNQFLVLSGDFVLQRIDE
jgi:hypothetical protein